MEVGKLAEVFRGELVESVHRGIVVVVDRTGKLIAKTGDPNYLTYMRSAAKPIQAIPVVEEGAADFYDLTDAEVAIICGSHSGQKEHQEAVKAILEKINLTPNYLQCGAVKPIHRPTANALIQEGKKPEAIHCPCSGKHSGMLVLTLYNKNSLDSYYSLEHSTQQTMLETVAQFSGRGKKEIAIGVDGCGVPVFGMSLREMALAYARLVKPEGFNEKRKKACGKITTAMTKFPLFVAGEGRFTTDLMLQLGEQIVAKDGGEAVFCLGVPDKGWGIAIKIEDGGARALNTVVLSTLEQLGLLNDRDKEGLSKYYEPAIKNFRGEEIGRIRSAFALDKCM